MKAVSGKTWVQKAVFLEPKPLFSSAFTMWSRGWYLCMEFRMVWGGGRESRARGQPHRHHLPAKPFISPQKERKKIKRNIQIHCEERTEAAAREGDLFFRWCRGPICPQRRRSGGRHSKKAAPRIPPIYHRSDNAR